MRVCNRRSNVCIAVASGRRAGGAPRASVSTGAPEIGNTTNDLWSCCFPKRIYGGPYIIALPKSIKKGKPWMASKVV